jgi:hypothetical protein
MSGLLAAHAALHAVGTGLLVVGLVLVVLGCYGYWRDGADE